MALIANMVGRNEANRYLVGVLGRLQSFVDRICFTDDASDDATPTLAELFGADVEQTNRCLFAQDEHLLRTIAWRHLERLARAGDWVLAIDCDEVFHGQARLPALLDRADLDVLAVTLFNMWNETQVRVDGHWHPSFLYRLFRFYPGGEFADQKLACGSAPSYVHQAIDAGRSLSDTGLVIQHFGYASPGDKLSKYRRYIELDGGRYHPLAQLRSILDPTPTLVDWNGATLDSTP
jgi:glycosyltransferase involved in cell wall biosynthesis